MAHFYSMFGCLWDPLGTILACGNPFPGAPKAVAFFESMDLDRPKAVWVLADHILGSSRDCLGAGGPLFSTKLENLCQFLCFWQSWNFGRAGILASSRGLRLLEFSWEFSEVIEFDRSGDAWVLV